MRWTPGDRGNIEDMRGRSGIGMRAGGLGIGGLLLLLILSWATGIDFLSLVGGGGGGGAPTEAVGTSGTVASSPEEEKLVDFVGAVMDDTQATWRQLLGDRYQPTKVRLFRDAIQSACGFAQSASGPFYCPGDHYVYLDLGFFDELRGRVRRVRRLRRSVRARARARAPRADAARHRIARCDSSSHGSLRPATNCRSGSSFRRTVTRESGHTRPIRLVVPRRVVSRWSAAISRRGCVRPPRSATIEFSGCLRGTSFRTNSHTARQSSA